MLPIRNISYLLPMCCSFWEKCKKSLKTGLGCSTPLKGEVINRSYWLSSYSSIWFLLTFYVIWCTLLMEINLNENEWIWLLLSTKQVQRLMIVLVSLLQEGQRNYTISRLKFKVNPLCCPQIICFCMCSGQGVKIPKSPTGAPWGSRISLLYLCAHCTDTPVLVHIMHLVLINAQF